MRPGFWLLALAAFVCAYNAPQLLTGTVQFDGLDVHYSAQRYFSDELHAGRLPFWTPYLFAGFPFLADLQVGAWYPLNWPFFVPGVTPRGIGLELLLHQLIACGGTFALAMRLIGRPAPALAAGMFYALSGWFATHTQHVGMFETAAWLPWLVLVLGLLAERLNLARVCLAGLLGAAIALPGHFQVALYTFVALGVWAALEALVQRSWKTVRGFGVGLLAVGAWGSLLAAVMILPALELVGQSVRARLNVLDVDVGYFHPASLLTLVDPDYYGLLSNQYTGPGDRTQHYFYAGTVFVPLVLLGTRDRRVLRTAIFLGLPFVWYATGPSGGLFALVSRLPGFNSVELPMHGWFLPALGLALLGGAGLAITESRFGRRLSAALTLLVVVDVLIVNQLLNPLAYARGSFEELYGAAQRAFQVEVDSTRPPIERLYGPPLTAISYRNQPLQSRVETTFGYNPLELAAYADYASAAETNPRLVGGLAATHRLVDGQRIEPNPTALPLAFFARSIVGVPDEQAARERLADLDPSRATIVVGPPPLVQTDGSSTVSVVARQAESVTLHYAAASTGLLRVAIPAYPGWQARLNGAPLTLLTVDHAFLGVLVPPGEGDVRLAYTPRWFGLGAAISAITLAATLAGLLFFPARDRRRASRLH